MLMERGVDLLVVSPDDDYTSDYFTAVLGRAIHTMNTTGDLSIVGIHRADHVFAVRESHVRLQNVIHEWLRRYV